MLIEVPEKVAKKIVVKNYISSKIKIGKESPLSHNILKF